MIDGTGHLEGVMNTNKDQCPQLDGSASTCHQDVALTNEASKKGVFRPAAKHRSNYAGEVIQSPRSLKRKYSNFKRGFAGFKQSPVMIIAV